MFSFRVFSGDIRLRVAFMSRALFVPENMYFVTRKNFVLFKFSPFVFLSPFGSRCRLLCPGRRRSIVTTFSTSEFFCLFIHFFMLVFVATPFRAALSHFFIPLFPLRQGHICATSLRSPIFFTKLWRNFAADVSLCKTNGKHVKKVNRERKKRPRK